MKATSVSAALKIALLLILPVSCDSGFIPSSYRPVLPELPTRWTEILGEPCWLFEWIDEDGIRREQELRSGREIFCLVPIREWTSPVLAWPFWPARNLRPGMMRPCGALFPWDVSDEEIVLTWRGGVEAVFWKEMAAAAEASGTRLPWLFDWPRFRELLETGNIPEAVRRDPWLADWKEIAKKTVKSGFDRRRVVSRKFTELTVSGISGLWIGGSPFAPPLETSPDGRLFLNVTDIPDTWVSAEGILKCSVSGWVFQSAVN